MPSELEEVPWLEMPTGRDELLRALVNLPTQTPSVAILWIPMKPDAYSKGKPDTRSDFIPVSVPN
jgi:hypothetical protein